MNFLKNDILRLELSWKHVPLRANNQTSSNSGTELPETQDFNNSRVNKHSDEFQDCDKQSSDSQWTILSARNLQDIADRHQKIVTDV